MIIVSDLDGTLTTEHIGVAMGRYLSAHGRAWAHRTFYASMMPRYLLVKAGLYDAGRFSNEFLHAVLQRYKGITVQHFDEVAEWVVEHELWPNRRPDMIAELQRHHADGHRVIINSGGFVAILQRFVDRIGLSECIGSPMEVTDGRLTGKAGGPANAGPIKAENLRAYLDGAQVDMAYGDTFPDRFMLDLSQQPVAVYPDKRLHAYAAERGWRIIADEYEAGSS